MDDQAIEQWISQTESADSLINMNPSMFPSMGGQGSMSPALLDIKPDISKLSISASNAHASNFGGPLHGGLGNYMPSNHDLPYSMSRGGPLHGYHMPGTAAPHMSQFGLGLMPGGHVQSSIGMHSLQSHPALNNANNAHQSLQQSSSNPMPSLTSNHQPRQSPTSTVGTPLFSPGTGGGGNQSSSSSSVANQSLQSASKHLCAICGDRASGKHYGVYSCEGCKGFFKRTVRKELQYACRDEKNCLIDKRQRNRCQYCRYIKCLNMGMKREAVQEERQRTKERDGESEGKNGNRCEMPTEKILKAEQLCESRVEAYLDDTMDAASRHLFALIEWARRVPHFAELPLDDQIVLLQTGWNELLIASFAYRSTSCSDILVLSSTLHVQRSVALQLNIDFIFDRILTELVIKMREMNMDQTEIGCLRAVVLFNPDAKGLVSPQQVEIQRERVYASLEDYCKTAYPDEPGRFAKLLLRLPALRSVGLKCIETRFFFKLFGERQVDNYIVEMLEMSN